MKYKYGDLVYVKDKSKYVNPMQVMRFVEEQNQYLCAKCVKYDMWKAPPSASLYFVLVSEIDLIPYDKDKMDHGPYEKRIRNLRKHKISPTVDYDYFRIYEWVNGREKLKRIPLKKYPKPNFFSYDDIIDRDEENAMFLLDDSFGYDDSW